MKKILLLLLIVPFTLMAQFNSSEFKLSTSQPYKVIDAGSKYYFSRGNDVMMVKLNKEIIIQKYDVSKKKEVSRKDYPGLDKNAVIEKVLEIGDNYYIFYSLWDKDKELEQLFYMPINFENGTLGKSKRIFSNKGKLSGMLAAVGFYKFGVVDKFDFYTSFDDSKLLIKYRLKPEKKNDDINYDVIGTLIFDENLKELWSGDVKMPYTEAQMNNIDFTVDSEGNSYMLAEVFDTDVPKKFIKKEKNYHLELFKIVESDVTITPIESADFNINTIWINESADNTIYLAGYYNKEPGYQTSVDGVFLIDIDANGKMLSSNNYAIPVEVLNMYEKEAVQNKNKKKADKDKLDFESLDLDEILYQADGSIILVGEQYYVTTNTYTDSNGNTRTTYTYHYNDMLVTKISADGKLEWMKKLPKRQKGGVGLGGMSFQRISKNGNHYFFYLDHEDNIDLEVNARKKPKYHSDGAGGVFTVYKLNDKTGDIDKSSIVNMRTVPTSFSKKPIGAYQFAVGRILEIDNGLVFEVYKKGKEDMMIHVDF